MVKVSPCATDEHKRCSRLHQAARQKRFLPETVAPVEIAHLWRLLFQVERPFRAAGNHRVQCLLGVMIHASDGLVAVKITLQPVKLAAQIAPVTKPVKA